MQPSILLELPAINYIYPQIDAHQLQDFYRYLHIGLGGCDSACLQALKGGDTSHSKRVIQRG